MISDEKGPTPAIRVGPFSCQGALDRARHPGRCHESDASDLRFRDGH